MTTSKYTPYEDDEPKSSDSIPRANHSNPPSARTGALNTQNIAADHPEAPSKSTLKIEALELQKLGLKLSLLKTEHLAAIEMPELLRSAITNYQRFPSREAKRRQLQYVGRLMREIDSDKIEQHLLDLEGQSSKARYAFHQQEQWRDRLIQDPAALTEYVGQHHGVDVRKLRQLIKRTNQSKDEKQQKANAKILFRFIREQTENTEIS